MLIEHKKRTQAYHNLRSSFDDGGNVAALPESLGKITSGGRILPLQNRPGNNGSGRSVPH